MTSKASHLQAVPEQVWKAALTALGCVWHSFHQNIRIDLSLNLQDDQKVPDHRCNQSSSLHKKCVDQALVIVSQDIKD